MTIALSPETIAQYDYNLIRELRGEGKGWTEISKNKVVNPYGRNRRNVARWFDRETVIRQTTATLQRQTTKTPKRGAAKSNNNNQPGNGSPQPIVLPRTYNPLRNPPTRFKSGLHIDDWIEKYCGFSWRFDYLTESREYLLDIYYKKKRGIIFRPRDTGKTLDSIGVYCYLICEEMEPLLSITAGNAAKNRIFRAVSRILRSEKIRNDYGDILESQSMTFGEFVLVPELRKSERIDPVLRIATRGAELIGSHPRATFLEDIIQMEFKSQESNESLLSWFDSIVSFLGDTIGGTGTRKGLTDIYSELFKRGFSQQKILAIKLIKGRWPAEQDLLYETMLVNEFEEDVPVGVDTSMGAFETIDCPNWPLEKLLFRRVMSLAAFESEMQNNPVPTTGLYFRKNIHWHEVDPYPAGYLSDYFIAVDPSFGKSTSSDYFCLLVGAVFENSLIIVDCVLQKAMKFDDMLNIIIQKSAEYQPHVTKIESIFAQTYLKDAVKERIPNIAPFETRQKKEMRIDSLDTPMKDRIIKIYSNLPYKSIAYQQFVQYDRKPSSPTKKDDFLDTLHMLYDHVKFHIKGVSYKVQSW